MVVIKTLEIQNIILFNEQPTTNVILNCILAEPKSAQNVQISQLGKRVGLPGLRLRRISQTVCSSVIFCLGVLSSWCGE